MLRSRLNYLLEKYQEKKLTEDEAAELNAWYEKELKSDLDVFDNMSKEDIKAYSKSLLISIKERIEEKEAAGKNNSFGLRWAAAAVLILSAGFIMYQFGVISRRLPENIAATGLPITPATELYRTDSNDTRQSRTIRLADCSIVELAPGSSIQYDRFFGQGNRILILKGAGYFDVQKGSPYPFTVKTDHISTTALGTSFTIDASATGRTIIKLLTGKVSVQFDKAPAVFMLPGDSLVMHKTTGIVEKSNHALSGKPVTRKTSSTNTLLNKTGFSHEFQQAPLSRVLDVLKTGYQVNIQYDAAGLNDLYFSGSIRENDSLSTTLKRLELLHDLQIRVTQTGLVIQKK